MPEETGEPSDFDFFGLRKQQEERKHHPITISIDPGSSQYLIVNSFERVKRSFEDMFPDAGFECQVNLHSPIAGTTIEMILTGASAMAGVVATEMLKEVSKDLWKALKRTFTTARGRRPGYDRIEVTLVCGSGPQLTAVLDDLGHGDEEKIERFLHEAIPQLQRLKEEAERRQGKTSSPPLRVVDSLDKATFSYTEGRLHLQRPACIACKHLEKEYLTAPCRTCDHYQDKPGKHPGRPSYSSFSPEGVSTEHDECGNVIPKSEVVDYAQRTDNFKPRIKVFVSHSSADKAFADRLEADLKAGGFDPWVDSSKIKVGESITRRVQEGLADSQFVVLLLSHHSVRSRWVETEWQSKYFSQITADHVSVLPALIEDCEIPHLLAGIKYAAFTADYNAGLAELMEAMSE